MAIYHMSAQVIGRSQGRSATAAAAYRAGERIVDERTGEIHDYTRKQKVDYKEILTPDDAGEWAKNRGELWNSAEQSEKRINSQIAREINIAIPIELNTAEGRELVIDYAQRNFVNQGMIADICIHGENTKNPHAHIMLSMREVDANGFTHKNRSWNDKEQLEHWREDWAHSCNKSLEKAGEISKVDSRSLEAQGIDREPTKHLGATATEIIRRGGSSEIHDYNLAILEKEETLKRLKKELRDIVIMTKYLEQQPEEKAEPEPEKKEPVSNGRNYNEHTTQKIIEYVKNEPDINKVKGLYFTVQSDAKKRDLQEEIKRHPEYIEAEKKLSIAKSDLETVSAHERRTAAQVANLGMIDRAKYKLGKHELNQQEQAEKEKKEQAQNSIARYSREFDEIKNNLTSPASDIYREIYTHNNNVENAVKTYQIIAPHYNERMMQERQKQEQLKAQNRLRSREKNRGEYER